MNRIVLSLGSNMGDRLLNLSSAINLLVEIPCILASKSLVYETSAWGNTGQPAFYNQVVVVLTDHDASSMMANILRIEEQSGRTRKLKWEQRVIDIDILLYNEEVIHSEGLTIPHVHLHERRFVLEPLNEILPMAIHPVLKKTINELLSELTDGGSVEKLKMISPL